MIRYTVAICWAFAMIILALLAGNGWVARDAAAFLLLVMPALAFVTIQPRNRCDVTRQAA